jgi:5-methyltetrahydrofolate--homocysteine methyltransferase
METKVSSNSKEVIVSFDRPTVLIGERINPTGKKKLAAALLAGDMEAVRSEALAQVQAGADVLDVNVGATGVDEVAVLPEAVKAVMEVVEVPLCLDSHNPRALEAALKVYSGKPIINSVSGQESALAEVLPLVKQYGAAVIGLTMDDEGIPQDPERRLAVARKIIERAEALGIPREDIIIDCLTLTIGSSSKAGWITLEAIRKVKAEFGVNQTLGASNVSFGLPNREVINNAFIAIAIVAGVTCPTVNVAQVRPAVLAADMVLGRDNHSLRYIRAYRQSLAAAHSSSGSA